MHPAGGAPAAAWGQVKPATILFADIAGSTEQIAALDPEQAMQQLQPAIERMVAVVGAHGGSVLRTLGDGVMALFGVPLALEHHAQQACHAALALRGLFAADAGRIVLRIGLHSGRVASDPTEAGDRRGGRAHGVSIHLASRVSAQAQPGQILLTAATRDALHGAFVTEPLGDWHLKGIVEPVTLFSLERALAAPSLPAAPSDVATRFVGRGAEMDRLLQLLALARQGGGMVLSITGEAGAGKSRLCAEFAARCRAQGVAVHRVRAAAHGQVVPMAPVLELLRAACFGLDHAASAPAARRAVEAVLARIGRLEPANVELFGELLGLAEGDADARPSAHARPARLQALVEALVRDPQAPCRVLIVEDLHWLDRPSQVLLNVIAAAVAGTRTLLVCNSRTSPPPEWVPLAHSTHLSLGALSAAQLRELLAPWSRKAADRSARLPDGAIDRLIERSHGNPMFAEELARHVVHGGGVDTLPDSIEAIVGARLDALDGALRNVLNVAAVLGQHVDTDVLARVLAQPAGALAAQLERLCALGVMTAGGTHGSYDFRHPLLQEVAYASQLRARRRDIHARIAAALEQAEPAPQRRAEHAWRLAHHHEQAGHKLDAARHAAEAASLLTYVNALEMSQRWRKVLTLLEGESDPRAPPLRALAAGRVVYLGWRAGMAPDEARHLIAQALDDAAQIDSRLPQLLLFAQARVLQSSGGPADDYVAAVRRTLAMPAPAGDPGRRVTLQLALCQALGWAGLLREALAANDEVVAGAPLVSAFDRDFIGFDVERWALALRVRLLCRSGRLRDAQTCLQRLKLLARAESDPVILQMVRAGAMELDAATGRLDGVNAAIAEMARVSTLDSGTYLQVAYDYFRGLGDFASKRFAAALACFQRGLLTLRATRVAMDFEADLLAAIAETRWALGEGVEARAAALEALRMARQRNHRVAECRALLVLARGAQGRAGGESPTPGEPDWLAQAGGLLELTGAEQLRPLWRALQAKKRRRAAVAPMP